MLWYKKLVELFMSPTVRFSNQDRMRKRRLETETACPGSSLPALPDPWFYDKPLPGDASGFALERQLVPGLYLDPGYSICPGHYMSDPHLSPAGLLTACKARGTTKPLSGLPRPAVSQKDLRKVFLTSVENSSPAAPICKTGT